MTLVFFMVFLQSTLLQHMVMTAQNYFELPDRHLHQYTYCVTGYYGRAVMQTVYQVRK